MDQLDALVDHCTYLIYQKEEGDNKTPHFQGYVHFKNAVKFSTMRNKLPGAHLSIARGSGEVCLK